MGEMVARSLAALDGIAGADRHEVWITLADPADVRRAAEAVEQRQADGEVLPFAGITVGVKDNIDVAGLPTTAACPAFATVPDEDAPCVAALVAGGAIILGKTNMDQFATGLVGTRSPYGVVANAHDPRYIAGGSSSGSAVAVALGQVDVGLGTDTAGSGRLPAAFNGVIGLKPTRGLVSTRGTVPACASLDCISVFARSVALARRTLRQIVRPDLADPYRRLPIAGRGPLRSVGFPLPRQLDISAEYQKMFELSLNRLEELGIVVAPVDFAPFLEAGRILYGGSLVAERYAGVGEFVATHRADVDPYVAEIIMDSAELPAYQLARDLDRLVYLRSVVATIFAGVDALIVPTAPCHPLITEVAADPQALNAQLGIFSHFCNPLDLCAIALPAARTPQGLPWGVTVYGPAFADDAVAALGSRFVGEALSATDASISGRRLLVVAGAHLRGQPLNGELLGRGGRFESRTTTAAAYRFYRLATTPPKPALVRTDSGGGQAIEVETWSLDDYGFADVVSRVPPPMAIGLIELADGTWEPGFVCQPDALASADDITAHRSWRAYLQRS